MSTTPYHHGSLRQVLLEEGRLLLAERGVAAVTLRELARRAGVSHAAPLRHFPDREALLDAIAAEGFDELTAALVSAAEPTDLHERLSLYAHTHVHFAVANAALMELMFSRNLNPGNGGTAAHSAARFFTLGARLLGEANPQALGPLPYLLTGMLEGISSLAARGRLPKDRIEEITSAAVEVLLPMAQSQLQQSTKQAQSGR